MAPAIPEERVRQLVDLYHPLLDESTIIAIAHDYDLEHSSEYENAKESISALAAATTQQEIVALTDPADPADRSIYDTDPGSVESCWSSRPASPPGTPASSSPDSPPPATDDHIDVVNGSTDEKFLCLRSIFSTLTDFDVLHTLEKNGGVFEHTLNELLTRLRLHEEGELQRGSDGLFANPDEEGANTNASKKYKAQKRNNRRARAAAAAAAKASRQAAETGTLLQKQNSEVQFLGSRFGMPLNQAVSIYRQNGCCRARTILGILRNYSAQGLDVHDDERKTVAAELAAKYPGIPPWCLAIIVQVTGSVPSWPAEVTEILHDHISSPPPPSTAARPTVALDLSVPIQGVHGATVYDGIDGDRNFETVTGKSPTTTAPAAGSTYAEAMTRFEQLQSKSREAASTAAGLARRGQSQPLYRQAAAVYSETSRDYAEQARCTQSAAADELVRSRSSPGVLDLHGVSVADGVRIVEEKVQAWWSELKERRDAGREPGPEELVVIVGLGRHNSSGISMLRKSVAATLKKQGWKIRVETGRFVVEGRVRA